MQKAIKIAKKSYHEDEVPVGALIIDCNTGEIISASGNLMKKNNDPTLHAEMNVIKEACKKKGTNRLTDCDMYVTLEPCPMCAQAISFARIKRLYFGAYDTKGGGVEHGARIFEATSCFHKPEIYGGINELECGQLLKDFFLGKR
ncbi:MAG: nucleoside deaminase [Rickettsiales bacterium]|nr:nucleoside deaminase [Pseudomonadota bacterium]MDG4542566.1 nucleoside deaminase [Rickettsiales bacterium]MDG4545070.1 nucleoside deaminase [Rickettsiales bacterium]MDG4547193.1 nucleoside deaminase [Rickettsiales bacterium]